MAEPTSTGVAASITGAMVLLMGPVLGPWVSVLLAAFIGALWTLGRVDTPSRLTAAMLLARIVLTALVLTGGIAAVIVSYFAFAADQVLTLTAFVLGAVGDKFESLRDAAAKRLRAIISGGA